MSAHYAPQRPSRTERALTSLVVLAVIAWRRGVLAGGWANDKRRGGEK